MRKVLVTGATGQIGSELVMTLRDALGNENVVAAGHRKKPDASLMESGPFHFLECTRIDDVAALVRQYRIDTIYHLAAILSASAEKEPQKGWAVKIGRASCRERV